MSTHQTKTATVLAVQLKSRIVWYTLDSSMPYYPGDWIVTFEDGTQEPFKKAIFEKLFTETAKVEYAKA